LAKFSEKRFLRFLADSGLKNILRHATYALSTSCDFCILQKPLLGTAAAKMAAQTHSQTFTEN
jgi:hypothetical protein